MNDAAAHRWMSLLDAEDEVTVPLHIVERAVKDDAPEEWAPSTGVDKG